MYNTCDDDDDDDTEDPGWKTIRQYDPIIERMWRERVRDKDFCVSEGVLSKWYNKVGKGLAVPVECEKQGFSDDVNNGLLHTRLIMELSYENDEEEDGNDEEDTDEEDTYASECLIIGWATPAASIQFYGQNEYLFLVREVGTEGVEEGLSVHTISDVLEGAERFLETLSVKNDSSYISKSKSSKSNKKDSGDSRKKKKSKNR